MFTNPISKIFVVLVVLASALVTVSFIDRSTSVFDADRSFDSVEQVRAQRPPAYSIFATVYNQLEARRVQRGASLPAVDTRYEMIEALRAQRSLSSLAADSSYDMVEQVRIGRWLSTDYSYNEIEALRLQR